MRCSQKQKKIKILMPKLYEKKVLILLPVALFFVYGRGGKFFWFMIVIYQNPTKGHLGFPWKNCWNFFPVTPFFSWQKIFAQIF